MQRYDPLLALLPDGFSRYLWATPIAYAILSIVSTYLVFLATGHLDEHVSCKTPAFWKNYSTLVNFSLLNPITIYFLMRSREKLAILSDQGPFRVPKLGRRGALLAVGIAILIMTVYVKGKFGDRFWMEFARPESLVIFFWTSVIIYFLVLSTFFQIRYVARVSRLTNLDYEPFHSDGIAGTAVLVGPLWYFLYALLFLFFIFVGFFLQDLLVMQGEMAPVLTGATVCQTEVCESSSMLRVMAGAVYIAAGVPLCLAPILMIRNLMLKEKRLFLDRLVSTRGKRVKKLVDVEAGSSEILSTAQNEIKDLNKLTSEIEKFPEWPIPIARAMIEFGVGPGIIAVGQFALDQRWIKFPGLS